MPWLTWGFERVVATDAVFASLKRFRDRLRAEHPQLLDRVLLIECDVRQLPLVGDSVDIAFSIESLYYLNEDYAQGLAECRRILRPKGRLLVAERSWEGALVTRLLYDGVEAMLSLSQSRDMWDGSGENKVRSRCFTEEELRIVLGQGGFALLESRGSSILSLVLGYLRGEGKLRSEDESLLPDVHSLLNKLGDRGQMRRAHVMLAEKRA
jgi:SAM-dependent methyltransferase